jgi:hypothetical protein
MNDEIRMTLRLPKAASDYLDSVAKENFTSRNAEVVRCIRERMQMTAGHVASETDPAVIEQNAALQGGLPITKDERTV